MLLMDIRWGMFVSNLAGLNQSGMLVSDQACWSLISQVGLQWVCDQACWFLIRHVGLIGEQRAWSEPKAGSDTDICLIRDQHAWSSMSNGSPNEAHWSLISHVDCWCTNRHVGLQWVFDRSSIKIVFRELSLQTTNYFDQLWFTSCLNCLISSL